MVSKKILVVILVLALIGVADASYALYQHYAPSNASACDVNETISCTAINQSEYSLLYGIPVAMMGIGGYLLMGTMASAMLLGKIRHKAGMLMLLAISLPSLGFSIWLTYIEIFVLGAVCPLCVTSQTLVALITLLAFIGVVRGSTDRWDGGVTQAD